MSKLNVRWLGHLPYDEALILQRGLHSHVSKSIEHPDYLLLLEHDSVITKGRTAKSSNILESIESLNLKGIQVHDADRGGDVTFHSKGQLVGYPLLRLEDPKKVIPYVRSLERVIISTLKMFDIQSWQDEAATGVWTRKGKISSIGIKVSKWTTLHGFALNVQDDLDGFDLINPCGFDNKSTTSIHAIDSSVAYQDVVATVVNQFIEEFGYNEVNEQFSAFTPRQSRVMTTFEVDELLKRGTFSPKRAKSVPVTINGLLDGEPKRPDWMKVKAVLGEDYREIKNLMRDKSLNTVCEEAGCPNIYECWESGTATFMIMGDTCTRACGFCDVNTGKPQNLDWGEPLRVAESVKSMELDHAVVTSVNRDDLEDCGSSFFAMTINKIRDVNPNCDIEVLIPDFKGSREAIENIVFANPDVLNHNLETVPRLQRDIRTAASYGRSLALLQLARDLGFDGRLKTGLIVGMGETYDEVCSVLDDLAALNVDIVTIGQYLRPSPKHRPISRYVSLQEFEKYKDYGVSQGIGHVESGPLVRSSYHAKESLAST